jgi:hypothetical protein
MFIHRNRQVSHKLQIARIKRHIQPELLRFSLLVSDDDSDRYHPALCIRVDHLAKVCSTGIPNWVWTCVQLVPGRFTCKRILKIFKKMLSIEPTQNRSSSMMLPYRTAGVARVSGKMLRAALTDIAYQ